MIASWICILLCCSLEIIAVSPGESSHTESTTETAAAAINMSTENEGQDYFIPERDICVIMRDCNDSFETNYTDDNVDTQMSISSWIVLNDWLINCINNYQQAMEDDNLFEATEMKKNISHSSGFLTMSSDQIYNLLETLSSYKHSTETFLQLYSTLEENFISNTNISNVSDCYEYHRYVFVMNQTEYLDVMYDYTWHVYVFSKYVQPTILATVLVLGFLMTGTLLFIFFRHKELRSEHTMIILNIAICDLLALVIVCPAEYVLFNGVCISIHCQNFYRLSTISITSTRALSILALAIQRLVAVTESFQRSCCGSLKKCYKISLFISFVWGPAFAFILTTVDYGNGIISDLLEHIKGGTAFVFIIALPIAITVINVITASRLKQSAKEMPGENTHRIQIRARYRSSKAVNFLCFLFWTTHAPFIVAVAIFYGNLESEDIYTLELKYVSCTFHALFYLNAFFNPLALAVMSKNFKILFKHYLLGTLPSKDKHSRKFMVTFLSSSSSSP